MSDARLRELERRFAATGAVADEAAWLAERLRAGALSEDRVALAAFCEHPAALRNERDTKRTVPLHRTLAPHGRKYGYGEDFVAGEGALGAAQSGPEDGDAALADDARPEVERGVDAVTLVKADGELGVSAFLCAEKARDVAEAADPAVVACA